jgi:hypothetical protein
VGAGSVDDGDDGDDNDDDDDDDGLLAGLLLCRCGGDFEMRDGLGKWCLIDVVIFVCMHTHLHAVIQICRHADMQTYKHAYIQTYIQTCIHTYASHLYLVT